MIDIILIFTALYGIHHFYNLLNRFFEDNIDYDEAYGSGVLYRYIHNQIITESEKGTLCYQFHNVTVPNNSTQKIKSLLITTNGVFIFNPIHIKDVTLDDLGYSNIDEFGMRQKLYIPFSNPNDILQSVNEILLLISADTTLSVDFYNVFTRRFTNNNAKVKNAIALNDLKSVVTSKNDNIKDVDIKFLVGIFKFEEMKSQKNKAS